GEGAVRVVDEEVAFAALDEGQHVVSPPHGVPFSTLGLARRRCARTALVYRRGRAAGLPKDLPEKAERAPGSAATPAKCGIAATGVNRRGSKAGWQVDGADWGLRLGLKEDRIDRKETKTMTPVVSRLLAEALQLPEAERDELIARLLDSLEPAAEGDVETAWEQEIQRRNTELDAGTVEGVPWSEARRLIMEGTDDALES